MSKSKNHTASFEYPDTKYLVKAGDLVIAGTRSAVILKEVYAEKKLPPVIYFPRQDCKMNLFIQSKQTTFCPIKGNASYYSIDADGKYIENVAWAYNDPLDTVAPIKKYIAFYGDRVSIDIQAR